MKRATSTDEQDSQQRWLAKLTRLNPASGRGECRGKAPHKPLMLLALLDLAESGELPSRAFTRSPGLALRFRSYGSIVADRWPPRLDLRMPFFHLSTQGFWEPLTTEMHRAGSPESCAMCEMHPEFFALLADATFRLKARMILVSRYFAPEERIALFETLGLQTGGRDETTTARVLEEAEEVAKRKRAVRSLRRSRRQRIPLHLRTHGLSLPDERQRDDWGCRTHRGVGDDAK